MNAAKRDANERRSGRAILDQMHVDESGTRGAPAIVCLHGAGASGPMWRHHMGRLTEFHCLAPDFPGFGRSNRLSTISQALMAAAIAEQRLLPGAGVAPAR